MLALSMKVRNPLQAMRIASNEKNVNSPQFDVNNEFCKIAG